MLILALLLYSVGSMLDFFYILLNYKDFSSLRFVLLPRLLGSYILEFFLLGKSLDSSNLSKLLYFFGLLKRFAAILPLFASTSEVIILLTFIESFFELSLLSFTVAFLVGI